MTCVRGAITMLLAAFVLTAWVDDTSARRVTITRERIAAAGATRLSDAMVLFEAWAPASNDGYTWMPTPRALTQPRSTAWSVVLNGHPLDVTVFDAVHLELVPVSIAEVDSIVFVDDVDHSSIGAAWTSAAARIEIYAARVSPGWTIAATTSAGNEIDDPGPYRYTSLVTPNVDAIGGDASLWIARGDDDWYASLSGAMMQSPFTDPAMRETNADALALKPGATEPSASPPLSWVYDPTRPAVLRTSASLRLGARALGGWHEGIAAVADARRYFHQSEPFGGEVPTDQRTLVAGLTGTIDAGTRTQVGYRALATSKDLEDQDGALAFEYDWYANGLAGGVDVTHERGRARAVAFASVENQNVEAEDDTLSQDEDTFVRAGARFEGGLGRGSRASIEAAATSDGDANAFVAAAGLHWVVRPADTVWVRVAVQERLFTENDDLWLWSERGYDLLAKNGVSYSIDGAIDRTRVSSADVGWSSSGVMGGVELNAGLRRFDDAYVATQSFTYDAATCAFSSPTAVVTGQGGHVGVVEARLYHALGSNSGGSFSWAYVEEFDSDPALGATWQTVPRHRLRYALWARPRPTWGLWARVCHYSATTWNDYAGVDGVMCDADGVWITYHSTVDGATFVDAMLQHGMWRQQLWIDAIARNVFDADVRYHPTGATFDLTLFLQVRLLWGSR